jgi:beta-N-acetylhexosaminidase
VSACGKHFPGHGDTSVDSHEDLPIVAHDRRRLEAVELVPFRRAVAEGVATLMTAHVLIPDIDEHRPASLSPRIVQEWLKDTLGYQGVVISDDLGMKAISRALPLGRASVDAIAAGCDALLLCNSTVDEQVDALEALIHAAETGELRTTRIDDALKRQHEAKARLLPIAQRRVTPIGVIGCEAHQVVAREMAAWL